MDEAQEILNNSLENSGISLPIGVSSIQDLTTGSLVSICAQSLRLIDDSQSFPTSLPTSMAERFRLCTEIASAIKNLGYRGDLSFHQFLYPSDEDSYNLMRFLVERLSRSSEGRTFGGKKESRAKFLGNEVLSNDFKGALRDWVESVNNQGADQSYQTTPFRTGVLTIRSLENRSGKKAAPLITRQVKTRSRIGTSVLEYNELRGLHAGLSESSDAVVEEAFVHGSLEPRLIPQKVDQSTVDKILIQGSFESNETGSLRREKVFCGDGERESLVGESEAKKNERSIRELEQKFASFLEQSSKLKNEVVELQRQEKMLTTEVKAKALETQKLENEHVRLKAALDMTFDEQHSVSFYLEELKKRVDARKQNLEELKSQWDAFRCPLEDKKTSFEQSLHAQKSKEREKVAQLNEVEQEIKATLSEIQKREEECSELSVKLESQLKVSCRNSYIQRITKLTKNSGKQDADIDRIIQETRQLQIENNSIQERLLRTYTIVDETIFRDAKKDAVSRRAYRLLTSIHESFGQISDTILTTDRVRREAAEHETKLAAMSSRNLDARKLQADIDSILNENAFLEQQLLHNRER